MRCPHMANNNPIANRLPLFLLLFLLVGITVYIQWPKSEQKEQKSQRIVPVKTVSVKWAEFKDSIEAVGTARANN